ncbi:hypothetical protein MUK42_26774 [Musa troglodytarum]|uniref:Uncharacterized protein n=1 Tax=Musa troglodytarum TaxID=320322 RepID=A0A9E7FQB3_9LILI|nr:hypothetical protein MUK42_26774 [Musa troglodytarum]
MATGDEMGARLRVGCVRAHYKRPSCGHPKTSGDAISRSRGQALPPRRYFLSRLCASTALNKAAAHSSAAERSSCPRGAGYHGRPPPIAVSLTTASFRPR